MNNIDEDLNALAMHESFARFVKLISELREEKIGEMFESSTEGLQQVSGMILAYDQLLQMTNWEKLRVRHGASLQ
jgi:hypothetical protein